MVPIGGMGAVSDALVRRARELGVEIVCGAEVIDIDETAEAVTVTASREGAEVTFAAPYVLAAIAPSVLDRCLDRETEDPVGAQIKVNMLLDRLPRLKSGMANSRLALCKFDSLRKGCWPTCIQTLPSSGVSQSGQ